MMDVPTAPCCFCFSFRAPADRFLSVSEFLRCFPESCIDRLVEANQQYVGTFTVPICPDCRNDLKGAPPVLFDPRPLWRAIENAPERAALAPLSHQLFNAGLPHLASAVNRHLAESSVEEDRVLGVANQLSLARACMKLRLIDDLAAVANSLCQGRSTVAHKHAEAEIPAQQAMASAIRGNTQKKEQQMRLSAEKYAHLPAGVRSGEVLEHRIEYQRVRMPLMQLHAGCMGPLMLADVERELHGEFLDSEAPGPIERATSKALSASGSSAPKRSCGYSNRVFRS